MERIPMLHTSGSTLLASDATGVRIVPKPTFLVVGAQKAGTTSLYNTIKKHPNVGRANTKEVHFFDRFYSRGMEWYEQQFRLKPEHSKVGEATPVYMYDAELRARIAADLKDIKILVIVRDPVARAYSHF